MKPSMNWTAKQLADFAFDLGLAEQDIYRLRGGPLPKATLVRNINERLDQLKENAK